MLEMEVAGTTVPEDMFRSFSVGEGRLEVSFRTDEDREDLLKELADKVRNTESIDVRIGSQIHTGYKINGERQYGVIGICDYIDMNRAMLTIRLINEGVGELPVGINGTGIKKGLFTYARITRAYIDMLLKGGVESKDDLREIDKRIKSVENIDEVSIGNNRFSGYCLARARGRCDFVNQMTAMLEIRLSKTNL